MNGKVSPQRSARERVRRWGDYTFRTAELIGRHPQEAVDRVRGRMEIFNERRRLPTQPQYAPDANWERRVHELLDADWPCEATSSFWDEWQKLIDATSETTFPIAQWGHDADPALARLAWCLVTHVRPTRVVETGVARGITSRFILNALSRSGQGHLWSIDLPPIRPEWRAQSKAAVPPHLRDRWTYIRGASRRQLQPLLAQLGRVDLFIHDSLHTDSNMRFELESVVDAVRPGGVIAADDIEGNNAFYSLSHSHSGSSVCARQDIKDGLIGMFKPDH